MLGVVSPATMAFGISVVCEHLHFCRNPISTVGFLKLHLGSAPPGTGSPGPFGPGTPEESEKSPERVPRGGTPRVPEECTAESEKSPKRVRKSGFGLFSDSFEPPGRTLRGLWGSRPGGLFRDSFRTLPGFRARRGRETLCRAGPILKLHF